MDLNVILVGAVGGAGYGLLGYAKNKTKPNPDAKLTGFQKTKFEVTYFLKSVLTGAFVGGAVAYSGGIVSLESIELFAANSAVYTMVVPIINKVTGMIWNIYKRIRGV